MATRPEPAAPPAATEAPASAPPIVSQAASAADLPAPAVAPAPAPEAAPAPAPKATPTSPKLADVERLITAMDGKDADKRTAAADELIQRYARSPEVVGRLVKLLAPGSFGRLQGGRLQLLRYLNASLPDAWTPAQRADAAENVTRLRGLIDDGRWRATEAAKAELGKLAQRVGG
jgi:hypothetical protein